jgi:hypothetical protein
MVFGRNDGWGGGGWIVQEEAERENDKLKFLTTYSFLEIYNEQVTDLLEPTSRKLEDTIELGEV